jgi:hypothetical protein
MTKLVNGNLCRQSLHNSPGYNVIYLPSTGTAGYARFWDVFTDSVTYANYTLIDGNNKEIGIGKYTRDTLGGASPGGYLERIQIMETVVSTTLTKSVNGGVTPINCSATGYIVCSPTIYGIGQYSPVWKTVSAKAVSVPTKPVGGWTAGWGTTDLPKYAECWFDNLGTPATAEAQYMFRMPMDFVEATDMYIRANLLLAGTDTILPNFIVNYWKIPYVNLYTKAEVDSQISGGFEAITSNGSIQILDSAWTSMGSITATGYSLTNQNIGAVATMTFGKIAVDPGSLLLMKIVRTDTTSPAFNVGLVDLFGEYLATQAGANNITTLVHTDHIPFITKGV